MSVELVIRARAGDREAFDVLVEHWLARLVGAAGLILRDRGSAEDATQDALVRAWRDLPRLREPASFDSWLYRLLVRACQDQLRRERRQPLTVEWQPEHGPALGDSTAVVGDRDELDRGLRRLTGDQRTVLVLRYYVGLGDRQIAEVLRLPVGTVKSRTTRAISALRAELEAETRSVSMVERVR